MRYKEYKPTDVFWLPEIPAGWDWLLLSQCAKEQCIKKSAEGTFNVMSLSYGNIIRKKNVNTGLVPANYDNYQVIQVGNIILRLTDLQNDHTSLRTGLVKETGIITSAYTCLAPAENAAFLQYLLHSYDTRKVFYGMGGGVRQSIGYKDIRNIRVPVPPREEQDQIVRYLDWKVSQINKLIAAKKQQITLLKEREQAQIAHVVTHGLDESVPTRDSEVSWIGYIPSHWGIMRCKYLFSERDERSAEGKEAHLSMSQKYGLVLDSELDERRMLSESYAGGKLCHKDDLVLNRLKAHLGVFALAPQCGVISPDYTVLVPVADKILPAFGEAVLKSASCRRELHIRVRGIIEGFWRLYTDDFNTIKLPLPSVDEQKTILQHIDKLHESTRQYEKAILGEIDVLHELRTRLISDAVTGQIDVRNVAIPEYEPVVEDINEVEFADDELGISEAEEP